jgi:AP-2 complex subunit alpha
MLTRTATQMIRLTIRATDESVPPVIIKIMEERLAIGVSTKPDVIEPPTRREISDAFSNVLVE